MSLQVWLPLNGNLQNKGLDKITVTTVGTFSYIDNGKIGKKAFDPSNGYAICTIPSIQNTNIFSVSFWYKPISNESITTNWLKLLVFKTKTIENEYAFDNFFMNKTSCIIYAGIIGSVFEFSQNTDYYRKYGEWGEINISGGFQTIDTNNNYKIKIEHMSQNLLRGISSGIQIGKKQIMTASLEGGILICEEK